MTLIKDLIDIPDRVQRGDFVLKLTEGVTDPAQTLREYVVTPELAQRYDAALSFIRNAVQNRSSKATYLHGSFGSGKSHFMAVLHLILQGNSTARGIPELASVIQKHNAWMSGKKFLLVPYHLIGAHDMESGILGNYVDFIRRVHPEAPVPPVYVSASIVEQAQKERESYGDEPFFRRLNAGGRDADFGDVDAEWDACSFERAVAADPDSEEHRKLVSSLLKTVASSNVEVISNRGGNFVRFDKGLAIISQHAKALGYDALILFLDELILWLATKSADLGFVNQEASKLTNLVEAQAADRPIPIVSFVARQRDLRELIGDHVPGAQKLSFADSLDWQQGRFDTITLEDRNLPAIAEKRVLKTKSEAAKIELDSAFEKTLKMKDNVMNVLLTHEGDRRMFRQVYPFSPALVQTLIAVSSVLQRERTALKVMIELLVAHRETLKVGDVVPVGDLFDVVAHGDEAFSPDMAIHFDNAKRLYHIKLLPMLEKQHGMRREDVEALDYDDPKRTAFRNDDRLVKTLLLSALVPEVESLRGLTAERLAALNHGTIRTPVPGREGQEVLRRCRAWAASVGEIRIGEGENPTIAVQLSGVDTESIIEQARREDNNGNRIRRIRQMLFEQLGVRGEGEFEQHYDFLWRNTPRSCEILFKNIRELPDSSLTNAKPGWKLIIDFPFDDAGHGPRDDLSVIQRFAQSHPEGTKTLCWVPSFFSGDALKDLGTLVILEHVLTGERFVQYSNHLSPQDRQAAKTVLESQRSQLRQRVQNHLEAAYGLDSFLPGSLDTAHDLDPHERYASLHAGFTPQPPAAGNLSGAMQRLLDQALDHEFPAAPKFETEIKTSVLKKVYELIAPAAQSPDGRIPIDKTDRSLLRHVANPLQLGEMGADATHFVLGQHWKTHFHRKHAEVGSPLTVAQLRSWIDQPKKMGLHDHTQNLIILLFAAQSNLNFFLHGGPYDASLTSLSDGCEMRTVPLPDSRDWDVAVNRSARIFGVSTSSLLSVSNVEKLATGVKRRADDVRGACRLYAQRLRERLKQFGPDAPDSSRLKTAAATQALVDKLQSGDANQIVATLAKATIETSDAAMAECTAKAAELEGNLETANWEIFDAMRPLMESDAKAGAILHEVRQALTSDEHAVALAPALREAQAQAVRLLTSRAPKPEPPPVVDLPEKESVAPPKPLARVVARGTAEGVSADEAKKKIDEASGALKDGQTLRISLNWIVEEGGAST